MYYSELADAPPVHRIKIEITGIIFGIFVDPNSYLDKCSIFIPSQKKEYKNLSVFLKEDSPIKHIAYLISGQFYNIKICGEDDILHISHIGPVQSPKIAIDYE